MISGQHKKDTGCKRHQFEFVKIGDFGRKVLKCKVCGFIHNK